MCMRDEVKIDLGVDSASTDFVNELVNLAKLAQEEYSKFSQEQVDEIVLRASIAANEARILLAKEAVLETSMGVVEDKVIKNHFAAEYIYNEYRDTKTCGEIYHDPDGGIRKIAEPVGIIAGIIPTTNPTSTVIFKSLLALKTRNAIVFCPHPNAKKSSAHAAQIVLDAAVAAGAPRNIITCIKEPSAMASQRLMRHCDISLILATGGPSMVESAYSSGTPAIGVGPGNTPVVVDETADIRTAVSSILISKTFDNGTICASEQSIIAVSSIYDALKKEFLRQGAYILSESEKEKVGKVIIVGGRLNAKIVGQSPATIGKIAGIEIPKTAKVLIAEVKDIGQMEPFSYEKLSPILGLYSAPNFEAAVDRAVDLIKFGGMGHTSILHTDENNDDRIKMFGERLSTGRILINTPGSQGAVGGIYNFLLVPSLTLGCGSYGGNSTIENVGIKHLLNIKVVAERRENTLWFKVPPKIYFKPNCLPEALKDLIGKKRAFIVTDRPLFNMGYVTKVTDILAHYGMTYEIFCDVKPDPDLSSVMQGLERINAFKPDVFIAFGGGSPMDAGKIMWLMYEFPETKFEEIAMRFIDIRKRICHMHEIGQKAYFVAIPTTSGTGSEVTPFAVITDDKTGVKYPIADYSLTPNMAIIDPDLVKKLPKSLVAAGGFDAVSHAVETYVATTATLFTDSIAISALKALFKYLPISYADGEHKPQAREQVHYAATMAGIAFANSFLGICHSLSHKLGTEFHIPHGVANSIMLPFVIRFNATDAPRKQGLFPQYRTPNAVERYAELADVLDLGGSSPEDKVEKLISAIDGLKQKLKLPATIKETGVSKEDFLAVLDKMANLAFDDQCTGANPRYPSIDELKELYIAAYGGL